MLTSGFKLSGRFVIEGGIPPGNNSWAPFPVISIARDHEIMDMPTGFISQHLNTAKPDGSFSIGSVPPGDFRVILRQLPPNRYIQSMRMGNADVLSNGLQITGPPDSMLEIVIGTRAGRIDGSVVNSRNEGLANRTVVLVPDIRLRQRDDLYKAVSTNNAGRFQMRGIAPGDYKLFAWENVRTMPGRIRASSRLTKTPADSASVSTKPQQPPCGLKSFSTRVGSRVPLRRERVGPPS